MNNNRYCIIMAGGVGSRFWPISRRSTPKQFLDILGTGKSFIRHTYERFARIIPPENFLVVTNNSYKEQVLRHIPEIGERQVLGEPVGRNTAPCIAYAAWRLKTVNPDATMIVTPADHLILNEDEFRRAIVEAAEFAENRRAMMTIGIRPNRPDTGYGYIQVDNRSETDGSPIFKVKTLTETSNWREHSSKAANFSGIRAFSSGRPKRSSKISAPFCPTCNRRSGQSGPTTIPRRNSSTSNASTPNAATFRSTSA